MPEAIVICALYKFVRLDHYKDLREPLYEVMRAQGVRGSLLLASEGINGTVAGSREGVDRLLDWLQQDEALNPLETKESYHQQMPFKRAKVKLKKEIVTMGVEGIDPTHVVGTYVEPKDWNALISDPDTVLVDTRNDYEVQIGTFQKAIDPDIRNFRAFPDYVDEHAEAWKGKKVAMFCTGGIRCEKSTAYLKEKGFDEVYHLKGGILKYLEQVPKEESLWEGECFVFDERVSVDHDLQRGSYDMCFGCRGPLSAADKLHEKYIPGVACPRCFDRTDEAQRKRFMEREKQMRLAMERGEKHLKQDA